MPVLTDAAQRHRHRRRGPPQPIRLRRPAEPRDRRSGATASPTTSARRCPTPPSSASPARRSRPTTSTRPRSSATTSTSTTSAAPSRTTPPCRSTTRAGWRASSWTRPRSRKIDAEIEALVEDDEQSIQEQQKAQVDHRRAAGRRRQAAGADRARTSSTISKRASTAWPAARRWPSA